MNAADVNQLLTLRTPGNADLLQQQVRHFTVNEAEHRDETVLGYFGKEGLERLVRAIADLVPKVALSEAPTV